MDKEGPHKPGTAAKAAIQLLRATLIQVLSCLVRLLPLPQTSDSLEGDDDTVEVYILMGQSNMLGMGHVGSKEDIDTEGTLQCAVHKKGLYPYLIDKDGNWVTSSTVRNVRVQDNHGPEPPDPPDDDLLDPMTVFTNEFLTIHDGTHIGPEVGIGHELERANKKIMLLKSCHGNRSLGWDILPPGSHRYNYEGKTYAGYKDSPRSWKEGQPKPPPIAWYAGKQYDMDTDHAKLVLNHLSKYYPHATKCKVMGFFWWQGDKDRYTEAYAAKYEPNLVRLIHQLRHEFDAPEAKFVLATLGQTDKDHAKGTEKDLIQAMMAVDGNAGKYPDFVGNVATVYSHPLSKGGASNGHYAGNAETYMNVGQAMGKAMVELISNAGAK